MSITAKRCDFAGYLSTTFFVRQQIPAQIVIDYLDEKRFKNTVFFKKPDVLYVDEDHSVKPPPYGSIDSLMRSLQENGPLVTMGKMGPTAYTVAPFRLQKKVCNQAVYGWEPDTFKEHAPQIDAILVGARQVESRSYVYFIRALDITKNGKSLIRGFKPSEIDARVYVMSYENFLKRSLFDLHPICPHGHWLFSLPVNSILDGGQVEKRCKHVGQQIFDHYKNQARGDSTAGRSAVIRICNAAKFLTLDGSIRKNHIEFAWHGVGDIHWRWQR